MSLHEIAVFEVKHGKIVSEQSFYRGWAACYFIESREAGWFMKSASTLRVLVIALAMIGCGARTEFGDIVVGDSAPSGSGRSPLDVCPSAVLAGAPKPMTGNCSTRDGRMRADAPSAPHIRWTTHVPVLSGGSNALGITGLVTDASGNTFVSSYEGYGYAPAFRKIDGQGNISWASNFDHGPTPFLMANDSLFLSEGPPVVLSVVDPKSGSLSQTGAFGFEHRNAQDPAIGRDGSIYFAHEIGANFADLAVSRANADGTIAWTSEGLSSLLGTTAIDLDLSEVALGNDDMVLIAASVGEGSDGSAIVCAFDPVTGRSSWTHTLTGAMSSDVRVRPDGSLVVSHYARAGGAAELTILKPTGELLHDWTRPIAFGHAVALASNGDLLLSNGDSLVAASGTDGASLWTKPITIIDATITTNGRVIATDASTISAFDFSSGDVAWTLSAPTATPLIGSTLTSDGTVIGVQSDGTVFGASD
jgi:hypothetical protein